MSYESQKIISNLKELVSQYLTRKQKNAFINLLNISGINTVKNPFFIIFARYLHTVIANDLNDLK